MSEREDEKITVYRHQLNRKIDELIERLVEIGIEVDDDAFSQREVTAVKAGAFSALHTLNDIVLGSLDEFFPFLDAGFGMRQEADDLAKHILKAAVEAHRIFFGDLAQDAEAGGTEGEAV